MKIQMWKSGPGAIEFSSMTDPTFVGILAFLGKKYHFPRPKIENYITEIEAKFEILGSGATFYYQDDHEIIIYMGFDKTEVRDKVYTDLQNMPKEYLDQKKWRLY